MTFTPINLTYDQVLIASAAGFLLSMFFRYFDFFDFASKFEALEAVQKQRLMLLVNALATLVLFGLNCLQVINLNMACAVSEWRSYALPFALMLMANQTGAAVLPKTASIKTKAALLRSARTVRLEKIPGVSSK